MKDYYHILQLSSSASFIDVINAYNGFINYFNSINTLSQFDTQQLKEIKEAYYVLGDYHRRRKYDNKREGYTKSIVESKNDRIFFRPDHNYQFDLDLRDKESDQLNNKKIRDPVNHTPYMNGSGMAKF